MPDSSAPTSTARPVRRAGRSLMVIIQVLLFVIVIIAANYLSCANHIRQDLTERKEFTLSDFSEKYLNSDAMQQRESPVQLIAVIRRSSPHYTRMYDLLDEYKRLGGDAVKLEFVDPLRQTDRTLEMEAVYGIRYIEDMIIIDARAETISDTEQQRESQSTTAETTIGTNPKEGTEEDTEENVKEDTKDVESTEKQKLSSHVRAIRVSDLYLEDEQRTIVAWQDEDMITSSFIGAIEGVPRRIYLAVDKINLEADSGDPAWMILARMLIQQNVQLVPIRLAEIESIPEDAEGFALIGPQYDLNDREIKILSEYWDKQQSALFVTLDPKAKLDNLRIFLRSYGITPRHDRIMTSNNGQTLSNVQAVFSRGAEINSDLGGKSTVFEGHSCSLEVRENDDRLLNKRIQPIALAKAATGWWGETRFEKQNPEYNAEEDYAPPLYLSAAVLRGQATSDETSNLVSKMVIIGNTDFIASGKIRPEQADFIKSSVNWLIGREDLIGIGPKKLHLHKITILDAHSAFINRVLLIFLPAASLLMSLIIWNIRRA